MFKTQRSLNPTFMKEIFVFKDSKYGLRDEHPIKALTGEQSNIYKDKYIYIYKAA